MPFDPQASFGKSLFFGDILEDQLFPYPQMDPESRERQARFACTACGFACNADVNAARNIAAGQAVTARGGDGAARLVNREPQLLLQSA